MYTDELVTAFLDIHLVEPVYILMAPNIHIHQ